MRIDFDGGMTLQNLLDIVSDDTCAGVRGVVERWVAVRESGQQLQGPLAFKEELEDEILVELIDNEGIVTLSITREGDPDCRYPEKPAMQWVLVLEKSSLTGSFPVLKADVAMEMSEVYSRQLLRGWRHAQSDSFSPPVMLTDLTRMACVLGGDYVVTVDFQQDQKTDLVSLVFGMSRLWWLTLHPLSLLPR